MNDGLRHPGAAPWVATMRLALALGTVPAAVAVPPLTAQDEARPRVGLVLSGGGARGAAHVGVLKVLEELRVPVDAIVGTSMGAVVGGLYASGFSAAELERELRVADWPAIFRDEVPRRTLSFRRKEEQRQPVLHQAIGVSSEGLDLPGGLVAGHRLGLLLETLLLPVLAVEDFDRLPIPFRATATDLGTGELVVLGEGDIARAIRASMAVPAAFAPVERGSRLLVDGGLRANLPLDVAPELDLDVVIAVDVVSDLEPADSLESLLGIARQVTRLVVRLNSDRALEGNEPDVLIQPDLDRFSSIDFPGSEEMVEQGAIAARQHAETLGRWALSDTDYRAWRRRVMDRRGSTVVPAFVAVTAPDGAAAERLERRLRVRPGIPVDTAVLRDDLNRIYGLGGFDRVGFDVVVEQGDTGLVVIPVPRSTGPAAVQIGLRLSDDFGGGSAFTAVARLVRLRLTGAGGELRLMGAFGEDRFITANVYQPFGAGSRGFAEVNAEHRRRATRLPTPDGREPYAERRTRLDGDVGLHFGTWAEATAGLGFEHIHVASEAPTPTLPSFDGWEGALFARAAIDFLDDAEFPRHGILARAELRSIREELGDAPAHGRLAGDLTWALSRGRNTVLLGATGGAPLSGELPFYDRFSLGGFLRLSGLPPDALTGDEMALGRLLYLRTLGDAGILRVGGGIEAGDAWGASDRLVVDRLTTSGVGIVGLRTLFGAVHAAIGWADGGRWAGHLLLGAPPF